jgi:hypothetical protein
MHAGDEADDHVWRGPDPRSYDADAGVREQALYLLRKFSDCEDDVEAVFEAQVRCNMSSLRLRICNIT